MTPMTRATNNIKYLGVTLTKQVKDVYNRNLKTLKKEIKEDLRKWKKSAMLIDRQVSYQKQCTDSMQSQSKSELNS